MAPEPEYVEIEGLRRSTTTAAAELHITGGARAVSAPEKHWSWFPVLQEGRVTQLSPLPSNRIDALANELKATLFGGDQISGLEGPLVSRIWTPLDGRHSGEPQPADLWGAISSNADKAGDERYADLAEYISFSLRAAGIRLRDASDRYHEQLMAAIQEGRKPGEKYSNIPMDDLRLAFHSVLSELASARDYLAASLAYKLGAPEKIDALAPLARWLRAPAQSDVSHGPILSEMLEAYDREGSDPWLWELTDYRNRFTHREPIGGGAARWLRYVDMQRNGFTVPLIELPLSSEEGEPDALGHFVGFYRRMTKLLGKAAANAPFDSAFPHFIVKS